MSLAEFISPSRPRAGQMSCCCAPAPCASKEQAEADASFLAAGFAFAVLSQILTLGMLPLAGALVAPHSAYAMAPYVALLVGTMAATLPASTMIRLAGQRVALGLGAGIGITGGVVMALALVTRRFEFLVFGAFLLGCGQGTGFFHRHLAASGDRNGRAVALVFGAGALAGLAGPSISQWAETLASPYLFAGTALAAALAHAAALMVAIAAPDSPVRAEPVRPVLPKVDARILAPTLVGSLAWFSMTALMSYGPLAMAGCGIAMAGITGAVAWHVVGMYAPALLAHRAFSIFGVERVALGGLALIAMAAGLMALASTGTGFGIAMAVLGIGWSLATVSASVWLHRDSVPRPRELAIHDAFVFGGALLGALASGGLFATA